MSKKEELTAEQAEQRSYILWYNECQREAVKLGWTSGLARFHGLSFVRAGKETYLLGISPERIAAKLEEVAPKGMKEGHVAAQMTSRPDGARWEGGWACN